jgi:predicted kinase
MATAYLLVGLPAAGKTTVARRLAAEHRALRLTPDEWMIPLFGESDAGGRRDVLEGRLISLALQALRIDTNVVLDLGCWARDERSALRRLVEDIGATHELSATNGGARGWPEVEFCQSVVRAVCR